MGICEEEKGKTRGALVEVFKEDAVKKIFVKVLAMIVKYLRFEM